AVLKAVADRYVMQRAEQERERADQRVIVAELSSHRAPVLLPGTPARTGQLFPRAPTQVRTPPPGTAKAIRFPHAGALRRPPSQTSTGPSADQRSPEHFHSRAIPSESRGRV
ncbi:hypothetical protein AB0C67_21060, partial [Streptomyces sp. NPDC048665]